MKYPRRAGMLRSMHMCAWYLGDQNGRECFPRRCAVVVTAFATLSLEVLKVCELRVFSVMKT